MLCTIAMYTYISYLIVYVKTNEKEVTLRVYINYIFGCYIATMSLSTIYFIDYATY